MKKLFVIAFCVLSLGAQANAKNSSNKVKKNTFTCIDNITVNGTVSYTCQYTGVTTTQNISVSDTEYGTTCALAEQAALNAANLKYATLYKSTLAALAKQCIPQ